MSNNTDEDKQIREDLTKLFGLLKSDKPQGNGGADEIEKSTLISLMLYLDLQKDEPEFFEYVKDKLANSNINEKAFIDTLLKPDISFQNLNTEKMASYFKIFDKERKGSFSYNDFIELYKQSPEYKKMDQNVQIRTEKEIKDHFQILEKDNKKEITPIEFYNIINFNNNQ